MRWGVNLRATRARVHERGRVWQGRAYVGACATTRYRLLQRQAAGGSARGYTTLAEPGSIEVPRRRGRTWELRAALGASVLALMREGAERVTAEDTVERRLAELRERARHLGETEPCGGRRRRPRQSIRSTACRQLAPRLARCIPRIRRALRRAPRPAGRQFASCAMLRRRRAPQAQSPKLRPRRRSSPAVAGKPPVALAGFGRIRVNGSGRSARDVLEEPSPLGRTLKESRGSRHERRRCFAARR